MTLLFTFWSQIAQIVIPAGSDQVCAKAQIVIISYHLLANDASKGKFQKRPDGEPYGIVIADESHNIKDSPEDIKWWEFLMYAL